MNRPWPSHLTSLSLTLPIGKISILAALSRSERCWETERRDVKAPGKLWSTEQTNGIIRGPISQVSDTMLTNKVLVISFCIHLRISCCSQLDSCGMIGAKIYTKRKSLNLSFQNFMTWYYAEWGTPLLAGAQATVKRGRLLRELGFWSFLQLLHHLLSCSMQFH